MSVCAIKKCLISHNDDLCNRNGREKNIKNQFISREFFLSSFVLDNSCQRVFLLTPLMLADNVAIHDTYFKFNKARAHKKKEHKKIAMMQKKISRNLPAFFGYVEL